MKCDLFKSYNNTYKFEFFSIIIFFRSNSNVRMWFSWLINNYYSAITNAFTFWLQSKCVKNINRIIKFRFLAAIVEINIIRVPKIKY